jgi:hypothetical protein
MVTTNEYRLLNDRDKESAVEKPLHIHSTRCAEQDFFRRADMLSKNRASRTQAFSSA